MPDKRLDQLAKVGKSKNTIYSQIEFVDIAGLVEGASKGKGIINLFILIKSLGLGNQFLSNIRDCEAILHLIRCFDNSDVIHVENKVDPVKDMHVIMNELLFSDLEIVDARLNSAIKKKKDDDVILLTKIQTELTNGSSIGPILNKFNEKERKFIEELRLISSKPIMFVCNVSDSDLKGNAYTQKIVDAVAKVSPTSSCFTLCASLEAEASTFSDEESADFLAEYGTKESGLTSVVQAGMKLLNRHVYYTVGEQEARSWACPIGVNAVEAAAIIHSDFRKKFICAEVTPAKDFIEFSELGCKINGKTTKQNKEYIVQDGDVMHFHVNK